jgi:dTDP-4-amino-4,6-dideoxygalactose transaminase
LVEAPDSCVLTGPTRLLTRRAHLCKPFDWSDGSYLHEPSAISPTFPAIISKPTSPCDVSRTSCYNPAFVTTRSAKHVPPASIGPESHSQSAPGAIPLLDLQRQYEQVRAEVLAAVGRVCASQQFILGPEVEALEREIAGFCGAHEAVGCASGTDALWLALVAAGVQPGDHVLTTPFSFFASASAIVRAGARPVFADIDRCTFNLDPTQVEKTLRSGQNAKLRVLLPVHLYGQCSDMDAFERLAAEFGLTLIEDAAQAIGASWTDCGNSEDRSRTGHNAADSKSPRSPTHRAGSMGLAATFSFYPTKNLSAYGEAGMVTTNSSDLAAHMRRLRNHGSAQRYLHMELGWNSRLDAIQAAILRVKLKYVDGWNELRRRRAATYDRLFVEAGLAQRGRTTPRATKTPQHQRRDSRSAISRQPSTVSADSPIRLPQSSPQAHHIFHQYVIRAHRRDELRAFLTERRIGTEIYYPLPLHLQPCFGYLGYREGDFPQAERAAKEVLALPMFPELTEDEQGWVVQSTADFYS